MSSPAEIVAIAETNDGAAAAQAPRRGRNGVEHRAAVAERTECRRLPDIVSDHGKETT